MCLKLHLLDAMVLSRRFEMHSLTSERGPLPSVSSPLFRRSLPNGHAQSRPQALQALFKILA